MIWLGLILATAGPFLLWPLEKILPYPFLVEEIFKLFLALNILSSSKDAKQKLQNVVLVGLLFAFSETFLYFLDIFQSSSVIFFQRMTLTSALHVTTLVLLILFGRKGKKFIFLGVVLAAAIHWGYNFFIPQLLR